MDEPSPGIDPFLIELSALLIRKGVVSDQEILAIADRLDDAGENESADDARGILVEAIGSTRFSNVLRLVPKEGSGGN